MCGTAFAAVGHVDEDAWVTCKEITGICSADCTEGFTLIIENADSGDVKAEFEGVPKVGQDGDIRHIFAVFSADLTGTSSDDLKIGFCNVDGWNYDIDYLWIEQHDSDGDGNWHPFKISEDTCIIIPNEDIDKYFSSNFMVAAEKAQTQPVGGGGGGGCSLGMLSPFALLLAVPLVLLRK